MRRTQFDLIDRVIGGGLEEELRTRRLNGATYTDLSVWLLGEHQVRIVPETLRRWCIRLGIKGAEDAA